MKLLPPDRQHLTQLMRWFTDEQALFSWAGPGFGYPFDDASFVADLRLDELTSFALTSNSSELLAFGQFYGRLGKCHLARLAVSPHHRGQGLAAELLRRLCERGSRELGTEAFSLFVLEDNAAAIAAYRKFGFEIARYPETLPADNCVYMGEVAHAQVPRDLRWCTPAESLSKVLEQQ